MCNKVLLPLPTTTQPAAARLLPALKQVLTDADVVAFLAASLCMGISMGTLSFLFLYAQQLGMPCRQHASLLCTHAYICSSLSDETCK